MAAEKLSNKQNAFLSFMLACIKVGYLCSGTVCDILDNPLSELYNITDIEKEILVWHNVRNVHFLWGAMAVTHSGPAVWELVSNIVVEQIGEWSCPFACSLSVLEN